MSVEIENKDGLTALQWECSGVGAGGVVDLDVVRVLLESLGAGVERYDRGGDIPL